MQRSYSQWPKALVKLVDEANSDDEPKKKKSKSKDTEESGDKAKPKNNDNVVPNISKDVGDLLGYDLLDISILQLWGSLLYKNEALHGSNNVAYLCLQKLCSYMHKPVDMESCVANTMKKEGVPLVLFIRRYIGCWWSCVRRKNRRLFFTPVSRQIRR